MILQKGLLSFLVFTIVILAFAVVHGANEDFITRFEVDLIGSEDQIIGLNVPDYIYFGNISAGEDIRTMQGDIKINNTGNIAVKVTARLANDSDPIFDHLLFSTYASKDYVSLENFNITLNPYPQSGYSKNIYANLSLTDYTGNVPSGITRMSADVIFTASS
jgi:hypothetical protein